MMPAQKSEVKRVVLDANIILSALLYADHSPGRVFSLLLGRKILNFTTREILTEVYAALGKARFLARREEFWSAYVSNSTIVVPLEYISLCSDPDDDKFLDCALAANAEFIIAGDKCLLALSGFKGITILSPHEFLVLFEY